MCNFSIELQAGVFRRLSFFHSPCKVVVIVNFEVVAGILLHFVFFTLQLLYCLAVCFLLKFC